MKKQKKLLTEQQRRARAGLAFVLPFIFGFMCFYLQPLVTALYFTFFDMKMATGGGITLKFFGLTNYANMINRESQFWIKLLDTGKNLLYTVPVIIIFSLFIAIILNQNFRGRFIARAIFFMPVVVTSGVVIKIIKGDTFYSTMESDSSATVFQAAGMLEVLEGMNLPTQLVDWFITTVNQIFDTLWKCGVQILLFLASLQSVPPQLYEAAKIEGATGWEIFWKVTFPNVSPIILVNVIYTIIDSITDASNPVMSYINGIAFSNINYDLACLMSWIFFVCLLVVVGAVFLVGNKLVFYQTNK